MGCKHPSNKRSNTNVYLQRIVKENRDKIEQLKGNYSKKN